MTQPLDVAVRGPSGTPYFGRHDDLVAARFTRARNDPGEGSATIHFDSYAFLGFNQLITIRRLVDGGDPDADLGFDDPNWQHLFTFESRNISIEDANPLDEAGHTVTVSGPGLLALLGTSSIGGGVVYPSCGNIDALQEGIRYIGWMSCCGFPHLSKGFKVGPSQAHLQSSPPAPFSADEPEDWQDPSAYRLWDGSFTANATLYLYHSFTLAEDLDLVLFLSMSETGEVFIDGTSIHTQSSAGTSITTTAVTLALSAGTHCIAAEVTKRSSGDLGWFMASLATATNDNDGGWSIGTVVARTNPNWLVKRVTVGDEPPGANVGEIAIQFVNECQALDPPELDGITVDFTTAVDSGGVAWADDLVYGVSIGAGILDVLAELADLTDIEYEVSDDLVLSIWQDRRYITDPYVSFPRSQDVAPGGVAPILLSSLNASSFEATALLVETKDGNLRRTVHPPGVVEDGARTVGATLGTISRYNNVPDYSRATFHAIRKRWALTIYTDGPVGYVPMNDFDMAGVVNGPGPFPDGGPGLEYLVRGLQLQYEGDIPLWTVHLWENLEPFPSPDLAAGNATLVAPTMSFATPTIDATGVVSTSASGDATLVAPTMSFATPVVAATGNVADAPDYDGEVLADNPLAYWPLSDTSGTVAQNIATTSTPDGTYAGSPTLDHPSLIAGTDPSVDFDGVDDYVDIGSVSSTNPLALSGTDFTWEVWIRRDAAEDFQRIIDKSTGSNAANGYAFALRNDGSVWVNFDGGFDRTWSGIVTTGEITHLVITYINSSNVLELFKNGVSQGTKSRSGPPAKTAGMTLFGPSGAGQEFNGAGQKLAIYDHALTPTRITAHFNTGDPTP